MKILCFAREDILDPIRDLLRSKGFNALVVADEKRPLHLVWSERPDIVFVDELLPGTDSLVLANELRTDGTLIEPYVILIEGGEDVKQATVRLTQIRDWVATAEEVPRLSPWNPVDPLRLLLYALVDPQRLRLHREAFGRRTERSVCRWLGTTLLLVPFLSLFLTYGRKLSSDALLPIVLVFGFYWLVGGLMGRLDSLPDVIAWAFTFSIWVSVLVPELAIMEAIGFPPKNMPPEIAGLVLFFVQGTEGIVVMGLTSRSIVPLVENKLENSVDTGRPSRLVRGMLVIILVAYAHIIWSGLQSSGHGITF